MSMGHVTQPSQKKGASLKKYWDMYFVCFCKFFGQTEGLRDDIEKFVPQRKVHAPSVPSAENPTYTP